MVWCWSKHPLKCMTLVGVFTSLTRQVLRPDIPLGRLHGRFLGLVPNKWGSVIGLHPCTGRSEQQLEMRNERLMLLGVRNAVLLIGFGHPGHTHTCGQRVSATCSRSIPLCRASACLAAPLVCHHTYTKAPHL